MITKRRRDAAGALFAVALLAGCGSSAAPGPATSPPAVKASLATSQASSVQTWAVVVMGGSSAAHNDFWQLFTRPAKSTAWALATPPGVADNGGLAVADVGSQSLVTAVRPSQDLTFTPLAASADRGVHWTQSGLLSAGLADYPDAFSGAPGGGLIALTRHGDAQISASAGAPWTTLGSQRSVAVSPAGRACGLGQLTAAAFSPSGAPRIGGQCTKPGVVGIFAASGGTWRSAGPALPGSLARQPVQVLGLARAGAASVALLVAGRGPAASLIAAWSGGSPGQWRLSAPFGLRGRAPRSAAFGSTGAVGVTLSGGGAVAVAGPGATWQALPALPAGAAELPPAAATLAAGPAGGFEALIAHGARLSVWQLAPGNAGWDQVQVINVAIPYGSSG